MRNWKVIWTPEKREAAIAKLTEYFESHGPGECICQNDDALIEAPDLLADIADAILIEGDGLFWQEEE
jgi:hypothetical protein